MLLNSVDRARSVKTNSKILIKNINSNLKNKDFQFLINQLKNITLIEKENLEFYIKKTILANFSFSNNSYNKKMVSYLYFFQYFLIFFISIFFNNIFKKVKLKKRKFKLIIDNIMSLNELSRYNKLIKLFKKKNVFIGFVNKNIKTRNSNYFFFPKVFNYNLTNIEKRKILNLITINIKLCKKLKINTFYITLKIINDYYRYKQFFEQIKSENIIMHQYYYSNIIKNILFKRSGGKISSLIQKNINNFNTMNYFIHGDVIFNYSENTKLNNKKTFSKVKKNISTGSFFLEKAISTNKLSSNNQHNFYDVLCLGGNLLYPNSFMDTYQNHNEDYIEHLEWLLKFSLDHPELKFGFKHHGNNKNKFEENFLKKSRVKMVNQSLDSYKLADNANFLCSWGSSMIVEMSQFNKPCFFLDPKGRNQQILSQIKNSNNIRIKSYQSFKKKFFDAKKKNFKIKNLNYCDDSKNVSNKIYNFLKKSLYEK